MTDTAAILKKMSLPDVKKHPLATLLGKEKWDKYKGRIPIYSCYCCQDKGLLPTYLAEQVMDDYDISVCQIICPLCEEGEKLESVYLTKIGYYQIGLDRENALWLSQREKEYWISRVFEMEEGR